MNIRFRKGKHLVLGLFLVLWFINQPSKGQPLPQRIPVTFHDNQLYVPVRINGRGPYHFLLDADLSGAIRMGSRVAKALNLNIVGFQEITEGTQHRRVVLVGVDQISIGSVSQHNLKIRVSNYNETSQSVPVDGVIGLDFFINYFVQIDGPANQLLVLSDTAGRQRKENLTYARPFLVQGKVGAKAVIVNVDVGAGFPILFPTSMLTGVRYTDTAQQQVVRLANTSFTLHEAIVQDEIELGGLKLTNQVIYYSDKVHQITIGAGFLKDHTIGFDQRRKRILID